MGGRGKGCSEIILCLVKDLVLHLPATVVLARISNQF